MYFNFSTSSNMCYTCMNKYDYPINKTKNYCHRFVKKKKGKKKKSMWQIYTINFIYIFYIAIRKCNKLRVLGLLFKILSRLYDEDYCYLNAYFFLPHTCRTRTKIWHGTLYFPSRVEIMVKSIFTVLVNIWSKTAIWSSWNVFRRHRVTVYNSRNGERTADTVCSILHRYEFRFFRQQHNNTFFDLWAYSSLFVFVSTCNFETRKYLSLY